MILLAFTPEMSEARLLRICFGLCLRSGSPLLFEFPVVCIRVRRLPWSTPVFLFFWNCDRTEGEVDVWPQKQAMRTNVQILSCPLPEWLAIFWGFQLLRHVMMSALTPRPNHTEATECGMLTSDV